jgi:hypothetical protein
MPAKLAQNIWLVVAAASLVLGYALLAAGDVTVAPLLLVAGYCVCVPVHLYRSFRRDGSGSGE